MLNRWVEVEEVFQTFFKGVEVKKESRERNDMKAKEETYTKKREVAVVSITLSGHVEY